MCVCVFTLSKINISANSGPIVINDLKHHWDGGNAALAFGLGWTRTLVFMARDSPWSYNGEILWPP